MSDLTGHMKQLRADALSMCARQEVPHIHESFDSADSMIESLQSQLEEAKRINSELEAERECRQLVNNEAISYLYEQWPVAYAKFYEKVDSDSVKYIAEVQAAAIDGYTGNMRKIMAEAEVGCEAGMSMMCSFAIKTADMHAADIRSSAKGGE